MKNIYCFIVLITFFSIVSINSYSQERENKFADPDSILIGNKVLPKVLLIGSWHFNYPGLDAHTTKEENRINIFSEKKTG